MAAPCIDYRMHETTRICPAVSEALRKQCKKKKKKKLN